ncbi:hypothetical protein [Pandoraea oxalativorans]|uniref:Fido domain-containing protein n=1 Tax=Pandoraea oxalativorans TaxID=573737 RepID=A0A0G3ID26_9BURK|nr:hypothetical protein [Pandoraea oxalativorans]AKK25099.1 hypothetical protein MB84_30725 [Pandoraea oxalativorans]
MPTIQPRGICAKMTRLAVDQTAERHPNALSLEDNRFENTNTEAFRRHLGLVGPASEYFVPLPQVPEVAPLTPEALAIAGRTIDGLQVPTSVADLGPFLLPLILGIVPGEVDRLGQRDTKRPVDTALGHLGRWLAGMKHIGRGADSASRSALPEVPWERSLTSTFAGQQIPEAVAALGPSGVPMFIDPGMALFDLDNRPYTADMFEDEPGYVAGFFAGMNYVESPVFDITQFECLKQLYARVAPHTRMCIPMPAFVVARVELPDQEAQQHDLTQCANDSIQFDRKHQQLLLKTRLGSVSVHAFRTDVDAAQKESFLKPLDTHPNTVADADALARLFDGAAKPLRYVSATHRMVHQAEHGPGYAEAYFPGHRLPSDFAAYSHPPAGDPVPRRIKLRTFDTGTAPFVVTRYQNEAHIRTLFEYKLKKFRIARLALFPARMQIALIAGFVAEMVNAHPFTDANNRIWTQIILNHLLRRCGQSESILAAPNGFAAVARYHLNRFRPHAALAPEPTSPDFLAALKDEVLAIEDGQRYYQALRDRARAPVGFVSPDRWL